jgi:poly(beta-D-mannuronate) lyase
MQVINLFKMRLNFLPFVLLIHFSGFATEILTKNTVELTKASKTAKAGDVIVMANGTWNNAEILFEGAGTAAKPITLKAQQKGKVIITGKSNLRIAGQHLIVEGLVFKNGYSPTTDLIAFRKDARTVANNCRMSECVIDNFNSPERNNVEAWVVLFGKNNRVNLCQFIDKRNQGVTLIVRLDTPESVENKHIIDHNYFGFRQNLGSNGGETIRIGVSQNSMMNSQSIVEYNYFDRCNGEQEIISNKSNQNTYRFNTFYECQGTLTMRHGNETWIEGNVLIGNGVAHTGGIRVINEKQTVINNYCEGLTGQRFRGALTVMNGVPNSPLNRYVPVKESQVLNNTFVDCAHIELGAGNDKERSEAPQTTLLKGNLFYQTKQAQKFGVYADLSGITFENNIVNKPTELPNKSGFSVQEINLLTKNNGVKEAKENSGAKINGVVAAKENTGVKWYPKTPAPKQSPKTIKAVAGLNTLFDAVENSAAGDLILLSTGNYSLSKTIAVSHPIRIKGRKGTTLTFETNHLFEIENGGSLRLENVTIDGKYADDSPLNCLISTSKYSMNKNYSVFMDNCTVTNLNVNHSFHVIKGSASTFADTICIKNSQISAVSGSVIALDKEIDDIGIYNAEVILIENCSFNDIEGAVVSSYRGGTDESTIAGLLLIDHSEFSNVGLGKRNTLNASLNLVGMQTTEIKNSIFESFNALKMTLTVGEPKAQIHHNAFKQKPNFIIRGAGFKEFDNRFESSETTGWVGDDNIKVGRK